MIPARVVRVPSTSGATASDLLPTVSYGCVRDAGYRLAQTVSMGFGQREGALQGVYAVADSVGCVSMLDVNHPGMVMHRD